MGDALQMALNETSSMKLRRRCLSSSAPGGMNVSMYKPAGQGDLRTGLHNAVLKWLLNGHVLDHADALQHLVHEADPLVARVHLSREGSVDIFGTQRQSLRACPARSRKPSRCSG